MKFESDVKTKKIWRLVNKLSRISGLEYYEGKRHAKVTCIHNGKVTMIPRHKIVLRNTANEILNQLRAMGFTDEDIENNFK